jgi:hypothetical protein
MGRVILYSLIGFVLGVAVGAGVWSLIDPAMSPEPGLSTTIVLACAVGFGMLGAVLAKWMNGAATHELQSEAWIGQYSENSKAFLFTIWPLMRWHGDQLTASANAIKVIHLHGEQLIPRLAITKISRVAYGFKIVYEEAGKNRVCFFYPVDNITLGHSLKSLDYPFRGFFGASW